MGANSSWTETRMREMPRAGLWLNRLLVDWLDDAARLKPDHVAIAALNSMTGFPTTLSWRELKRISDRIAAALVALGIGPGQVVSCQLPNWWEMSALYLGCARVGVIMNPLMPILRHREIAYMLEFAESAMVVVPRVFRGFDYSRMISDLRGGLPKLRHCLVVGGEGESSFEATMLRRRWEDELDTAAVFRARRPGPNDVTELLYTSGTTGEPKGVMHTPNTLTAGLSASTRRFGFTSREVILMASPVAHQTGFLYGLMLSVFLGARLVLQDIWSAELAAQLIADEQVTFTMASTPFMMDLTDSEAAARRSLHSLRLFVTAGAPIPRALVERTSARLGVKVIAAWGMTENGAVTTTRPLDPSEKIHGTDGIAVEGAEVRVVDEMGRPLPANTEGRLQERAAQDFVGYLKRPEFEARDAQGWFDTGDLARMDEDGYIRITGRAKDIIIRGGENIPVVEVENLLYSHPAIQDASIVAMPDARLGERACAFVTLRAGHALSFGEMVAFLEQRRMARQYFPERLEIVAEMPRTPSGKIQKYRLRELARTLTAAR